jgi:uncharacterized repeat protein (TIGR01451 family)
MILRTFFAGPRQATHVRIVVLNNQCTGNPDFQGEQDADPLNDTDCRFGNPGGTLPPILGDLPDVLAERASEVHISELQVFSSSAVAQDPVVALTKTGPATATRGEQITYTLSYTNAGPEDAVNSKIMDTLPKGLTFVSATGGGKYDSATGTVTWNLGTVPLGRSGSVQLQVKIANDVAVGTAIINKARFTGDLVVSPPTGVWTTTVR